MTRPYTVLSCAVSLDGYLDDASPHRLVLSNDADLDRVDGLRAECDALLVGAATVRRDDPRLLVRDPGRVRARVAAGRAPHPTKVTVTGHGELDPTARFFTLGDGAKLVYCASGGASRARERLGSVATVVDIGLRPTMAAVSADLHARGVRTLLVEGGGRVLTQLLTAGIADELHLAVAPFFIGDPRARRFVEAGAFPCGPEHPARLVGTRAIGDLVLLRYALSDAAR